MSEIELLQAILDALIIIKWAAIIGLGMLVGIALAKR